MVHFGFICQLVEVSLKTVYDFDNMLCRQCNLLMIIFISHLNVKTLNKMQYIGKYKRRLSYFMLAAAAGGARRKCTACEILRRV